MDFLNKIINSKSDEELEKLVTDEIDRLNSEAEQIGQLGFLNYGKSNCSFKGFIPFNTRIKYENIAIETYGMETTDFFYDFAKFIKKCNIKNKGQLIFSLEYFINLYFGSPGEVKNSREDIFNTVAWENTTTDEEYFQALQNNKLGDLKGKKAAECTERGALAQQILSLYGIESYYCMGCLDLENKQEGHCFNIVKRKDGYAVVDYSVPVSSFNKDDSLRALYPFVGIMSDEEFEDFIKNGTIKSFDDYEYINGNEREKIDRKRTYAVGKYDIKKEEMNNTDNITI